MGIWIEVGDCKHYEERILVQIFLRAVTVIQRGISFGVIHKPCGHGRRGPGGGKSYLAKWSTKKGLKGDVQKTVNFVYG